MKWPLQMQINTSWLLYFNFFSLKNRLDDKDQVVRINFNNATRDTIFDVPVERVQPFYAALKEFVDLMNCKDFKFTFKMNPGQWTHLLKQLKEWVFFDFKHWAQYLEQFFSDMASGTTYNRLLVYSQLA